MASVAAQQPWRDWPLLKLRAARGPSLESGNLGSEHPAALALSPESYTHATACARPCRPAPRTRPLAPPQPATRPAHTASLGAAHGTLRSVFKMVLPCPVTPSRSGNHPWQERRASYSSGLSQKESRKEESAGGRPDGLSLQLQDTHWARRS